MQTPQTDVDALAAAAGGDGAALATLYDRYSRSVYSLARRIVRIDAEAEDVVQEVFAQMFRQADRYDSRRGSVGSWLLTIARTRAIDHLRAKKRMPDGHFTREPEIAAANVPDPRADQESQTLTTERAQRVRRALEGLPADQRTAIELAYYEGLSQSEIAARLAAIGNGEKPDQGGHAQTARGAMSHDELRELASAYVLGALDADDRGRFEAHLATCAACQAEVRSFEPVVDALAQVVAADRPPERLRARVLEAHSARGSQNPPASRTPVTHAPSTARPEHVDGRALRAGFRPVAALPWFLVAAAAVGLAVLTPYTLQLRERTRELAAAVRDLSARLAETDRQLVAARSEVSLLAAPDVKRVDLRGQAPAPRAGGRAYWSPARGVYFVASDLPPIPSDKAYQLWFVTTAGPVSAGVFTPDEQGRAATIGQVPPGMAPPTAMAVTLEPAGGSPGPTMPLYLAGPAN